MKLQRRLRSINISTLLVQRRLRRFGHAARHPSGELIKDLLLSTAQIEGGQPQSLCGLQVLGYARLKKDCVQASSELAQDHRSLSASVRGVAQPAPGEC